MELSQEVEEEVAGTMLVAMFCEDECAVNDFLFFSGYSNSMGMVPSQVRSILMAMDNKWAIGILKDIQHQQRKCKISFCKGCRATRTETRLDTSRVIWGKDFKVTS